jgi:hypothetical protein
VRASAAAAAGTRFAAAITARRQTGPAGQTAPCTPAITGRQRYSQRKQKSRPAFGHASVTKTTHTDVVKITRFHPGGTVA